MPLPPHITASAQTAAVAHKLPVDLVNAIIQVESCGGNTFAIRYEPGFLLAYVRKNPECYGVTSRDTERISRAMSWGLMQVMGQTARELGYKEPSLAGLCDPSTGIRYGCLYLAKLRDRYFARFGWDGVIAAYNAGSPIRDESGEYKNQGYVVKVRKFFKSA